MIDGATTMDALRSNDQGPQVRQLQQLPGHGNVP